MSITSLLSRQTAADDAWAGFKLWHYSPSIPAAIIFTILFLVLTTYHSFLLVRRRTYFCVPFVVGGLFEIIGYIARAAAHNAQESVSIYAIQSLVLLLAPILFAASVYMVLGRIIRSVGGEEHAAIPLKWLTKIFVTGDVVCFMVQGAGGGMLATADTKAKVNLCNNIVLGGLILQILVFMVFVGVAVLFQIRMGKSHGAVQGALGHNSQVGAMGKWVPAKGMEGWKRLMAGLYITSVLITLRNVFRMVEYGMGWSGYLLNQEWVLYVFDGLLMVAVLVVGVMWYDPEISRGGNGGERRPVDAMVMLENGQDGRSKEASTVDGQRVGPWS